MSERSERLFAALSGIDQTKIEEAAPVERARWFHWKRWAGLAAALALVVGVGGYALPRLNSSGNGPDGDGPGDGSEGASTFMSYAGPVFPLTLGEADSAVTAEREITLDFEPWTPVWVPSGELEAGGYYQAPKDIRVTDAYTLTNHGEKDKTVSVLYPFASSLNELNEYRPALSADGQALDAALYAGQYSGGFQGVSGRDDGRWNLDQLNSWEQYKALLEDGGGYQQGAFGGYPDLSGIPTIVYEFTEPRGDGTQAASIQAAFELNYEQTQVLSFRFNGGSFDQKRGWMGMSFFIPSSQASDYDDPRYLIVLGDDIGEMTIQGYANLGCKAGDERDFTVTVRRYETSLEAVLRDAAQQKYQWQEEPQGEFDMFFALMKDDLLTYGILAEDPAERYGDGRLDDLDFQVMDRVFYLEAQLTIPAGGSVRLTAEMTKAGSFDYYCANTENQGVYGYDMVTQLGSNLVCTGQTAILEDRGQIEIVRQNFGFDLENGVNRVALDPGEEHYYLEVKARESRLEE